MFYKYDAKTKFYIGEVEGQINPVNPNEVLQPANTTTIKPPSIKIGDIAIFQWDRWIVKGQNKAVLDSETPEDKVNKVDSVTNIRNSILDDTDKYMLPDFPITEEKRNKYKAYRQYLRDITKDKEFPDIKLKTFDEFITK